MCCSSRVAAHQRRGHDDGWPLHDSGTLRPPAAYLTGLPVRAVCVASNLVTVPRCASSCTLKGQHPSLRTVSNPWMHACRMTQGMNRMPNGGSRKGKQPGARWHMICQTQALSGKSSLPSFESLCGMGGELKLVTGSNAAHPISTLHMHVFNSIAHCTPQLPLLDMLRYELLLFMCSITPQAGQHAWLQWRSQWGRFCSLFSRGCRPEAGAPSVPLPERPEPCHAAPCSCAVLQPGQHHAHVTCSMCTASLSVCNPSACKQGKHSHSAVYCLSCPIVDMSQHTSVCALTALAECSSLIACRMRGSWHTST